MIEIDISSVLKYLDNIENSLESEVSKGLDKLAHIAQQAAINTNLFKGSKTGGIRAAIKIMKDGELARTVIADKDYAYYLEYGRGPVVPVNAKALRFVINGQVIFSKYSGPVSPRPFMANAKEEAEKHISECFVNLTGKG